MFIIPRTGIKIRDPLTRTFVPEKGLEVVETGFWLRRVRDGDVTIGQSNQSAQREAPRKVKGEK